MPFYVADDEYDLPEFWKRADVDRELIEYARLLLGNEPNAPSNYRMNPAGETPAGYPGR